MYRSTLVYVMLSESTAEGDVLFARLDHVLKYVVPCNHTIRTISTTKYG